MSRPLARFYSVMGILALTTVTVLAFVRLTAARQAGEAEAAARFDELSRTVAELWQLEGLPTAGNELSVELSERALSRPLMIGVFSFDTGVDYLWSLDDRFLPSGPLSDPALIPIVQINELIHVRFTRSFELPEGGGRIVTAVYPLFDAGSLYSIGRELSIAALAFVAVSLLVAIIALIRAPKRDGTTPQRAETSGRRHRRRRYRDRAPRASTEGDASSGGRTAPTAAGVPTAADTPLGATAPASPARPASTAATITAPAPASDTDSPRTAEAATGLTPEVMLADRLSSELERAAFHEYDLSCALFGFTTTGGGAVPMVEIGPLVVSFVSFGDLCFEYGDTGVAVLFPNATLTETLRTIERFQRQFWDERGRMSDPDVDFACGVSARNGRLVTGARVLQESRAALEKARTTAGRIMGFEPDPERYRAYLTGG